MNFLSHYYLDREISDDYFTVGLITPDLISFSNRKMRITRKTIEKYDFNQNKLDFLSFSAGMIFHINIDKWFHMSHFFKQNMKSLMSDFRLQTNESLPEFYAHVLLEIFIDRFLIKQESSLVDDFYSTHRNFDFNKLTPFFETFTNFNSPNFLDFASKFTNASFFYDYNHFNKIKKILKSISKRIKLGKENVIDLLTPDFLNKHYELIKPQIPSLLDESRNLNLNKNHIINNLINSD